MVPGSTGVNKARQENEEEFEWKKTSYKTSKKSRKKNAGTAGEKARRQNKDARKSKELHNFPKVEQPATTYLMGGRGATFQDC